MQNEPQWRKALRSLCLKKLNDFGGKGTARQICEDTGQPVNLVTPRLTELADMGAIQDSGERISAGRGRPQVVWEVCDLAGECDVPGVAALREQDVPEWFKRYGN